MRVLTPIVLPTLYLEPYALRPLPLPPSPRARDPAVADCAPPSPATGAEAGIPWVQGPAPGSPAVFARMQPFAYIGASLSIR